MNYKFNAKPAAERLLRMSGTTAVVDLKAEAPIVLVKQPAPALIRARAKCSGPPSLIHWGEEEGD